MSDRINIQELEPKAYEAMFGLEKYLSRSTLEKGLQELIRLRASQINGCTFCNKMHSEAALNLGETQERIDSLDSWQESPQFSEKEKAVFAATEQITLISQNGLSDQTYQELSNHLSENEIAQLIMLIGTINMWNRLAISTGKKE